MKNSKLTLSLVAALAALALSGCGTVDSSYASAKGIGESAVGGAGKIVGNATSDVGRTFAVAGNAASKLVDGTGKVLGGSLGVAGELVKGTSEIVVPAKPEQK